MKEHCPNYDPFYEGCIACPGKFTVKLADGSIQEICQSGKKKITELIATTENNLPIFPIQFPTPINDD